MLDPTRFAPRGSRLQQSAGSPSSFCDVLSANYLVYVEGAARQRRLGQIYFFGIARRIRLPSQSGFAMPSR